MARFSWTAPKPKPVTPDVPVTPIIGGSPAASKFNVYTPPSKSKQLDYVDPHGLFPQDPTKFGGGTPLTYKNMANHIFNLFETKKIKTVDDYDNLLNNLMKEKWSKEKGFGSASASHQSAASTISEIIKNRFPQHLETWQNLGTIRFL